MRLSSPRNSQLTPFLLSISLPLCTCSSSTLPSHHVSFFDLNKRQQNSNSSYVGYVSDPNGRGTPTLVLSCLLTLVLCVWSALHLNVPQQDATWFSSFKVYVRWIITGVFGPELVAFTAWRQWCSARLLSKLVEDNQSRLGALEQNRVIQKTRDSEYQKLSNKWTMTHSFYALMGGFVFDIKETREARYFLPADCPRRLTLTARGLALLIRCGLVPDIPEPDIQDKSKANSLAKALVIIQAFWMMLQVLGRLAAALPVTLLEINTVAHV